MIMVIHTIQHMDHWKFRNMKRYWSGLPWGQMVHTQFRRIRNRRFVEREMEEVNPAQSPRAQIRRFPALFSGPSMEMAAYGYNWAALIGSLGSLGSLG